jgi:hypothetical protein
MILLPVTAGRRPPFAEEKGLTTQLRAHTFHAVFGVRACSSAAKSIAVGAERWIPGSIANESHPFCASHAAAAAAAHVAKLTSDGVVKLQPELRFFGLRNAWESGVPQWPPVPEQYPA